MTKEDTLAELGEKYLVFYDGDCGFCNHWVQWILAHDKDELFLFSALQSYFGQQFLLERALPNQDFDSLILWKPNQFYLTKYHAVIKIATELKGIYSLAILGKLLPETIGNIFYNLISKNRKKFFSNACFVPTPEQRKKFIE